MALALELLSLSLLLLYHHPLGVVDLTYQRLGLAPGVLPLPLGRPQVLPKIPLTEPSSFTITCYPDSIAPPEGPIYSPTARKISLSS